MARFQSESGGLLRRDFVSDERARAIGPDPLTEDVADECSHEGRAIADGLRILLQSETEGRA
jgi:hypothetical protein